MKPPDKLENDGEKTPEASERNSGRVSADCGTVDSVSVKNAEQANKDRIKGSATAFMALRDNESLDQFRVRTLQHQQSEMGLVDEQKGIIHTAKGLAPLIKDDCPYELAKLLSKVRARNESELAQKVKLVYATLSNSDTSEVASQTTNEAPHPKRVDHAHAAEKHAGHASDAATDAGLNQLKAKVWDENGVDVKRNSKDENKLVYFLRGSNQILCEFENTAVGIEKAQKRIEQIRADKESYLSKEYGAKFTKNGETAGLQCVYDAATNTWIDGTDLVKCRTPSLHELLGIEAALKVTQPSAHGIKFFIMENQLYKGITEGADYHLVPKGCSDNSTPVGSPAIFINGETWKKAPPTEAVASVWQANFNWSRNSIERAVVHELGHHSQSVLDWSNDKTKATKGFGVTTAEELGWTSPKPFTNDTRKYLIKDSAGGCWKHELVTGKFFVRMSNKGTPLDEHGKPCEYKKAQRITNDQMANLAKVTPMTSYLDAPDEVYAEGLAAFRDGDRANLFKKSPVLYDVIKKADQKEINLAHPADRTGKPTYVRNAAGQVVPNTEAVQTEIHKIEK